MTIERIIKRPDGSRVKLRVSLRIDAHRSTAEYIVYVRTCLPGKRTWNPVIDGNDYKYKALPFEDRGDAVAEAVFKHITPEELEENKEAVLQKLRNGIKHRYVL